MITDDDSRALPWNVFNSRRTYAVHDVDAEPREEAHQEFGQQRININRDDRVHRGDEQKQLGNRKTLLENDYANDGGGHN